MRAALVGREETLNELLERLREPGGVLLTGVAGVGKSRLVEEAVSRLKPDAWAVHRFCGTRASRRVPFSAFFDMLPTDAPSEHAQLLADVGQNLVAQARGRRLLLALDDVPWVDETSLMLVAELVRRCRAVVLLTARTEDRPPDAIEGLLTEGLVERRVVHPLDQQRTTALVEGLLGGPAHEVATQVHARSGGNPLLTRELVLDAVESGSIASVDGAARLTGPLEPGLRVQQAVVRRTARLPKEMTEVLEWVCLAQGLDLSCLDHTERDAIGELERHGLVEVERRGHRLFARPAHPLIAEAVADSVPTHRRADALTILADRIAGVGDPAPGDALRAAEWMRSLRARLPAALVERALAEGIRSLSLRLARWIATSVLEDGASPVVLLDLADVHRLQARPEEALEVLRRSEPSLATDELRARAAEIEAKILSHHQGRSDAAAELLVTVAAELEDPILRRRLRVMARGLGGHLGSFDDVLEVTARRLDGPSRPPLETFWDLYFHVFSGVMVGRTAQVDGSIDEALALSGAVADAGDDVVDVLWAMRALVHAQRGRLRAGRSEIEARIERCQRAQLTNVCTTTFLLPILWHGGDLRACRHHAGRLRAGAAGPDSWGLAPVALAMAIRSCLLSGSEQEAHALLAELPDRVDDERTAPFVAIGRLAALRAAGETHEAAAVAEQAVRRATDTTHGAFGLWVLQASLDPDTPDAAARCLDAAVSDSAVDGPMLRAILRHAQGIAARDGSAVGEAAGEYRSMGADLDAAVAALHATAILDPSTVEARRWAARAALLAADVEGARMPEPQVPGAVSGKELEVAVLAVDGRSNREIADALVVSKRTVDNHLYRSYRKLDVGSRAELAAVLSLG